MVWQSVFVVGAALIIAAEARADGVYRSVDESGRVVYTDRKPAENSERIRMQTPTNPSRYEYESARIRAESERTQSERSYYEERQRRPIVIHDPHGLQTPASGPYRVPGAVIRRDPNLPDAPPPSSDRQYFYQGR